MYKTIRNLVIIIFSLNAFTIAAQTNVPAGAVNGVWTLSGSPYLIQGNILILSDSTLTIEPGVTVDFQGAYKLNVQGQLLAVGTTADTIIFTATNITAGWKGLRFDNIPITNDTSRVTYCKLQYGIATGATPQNYGGGIYFNNSSKVIVSKSAIVNCKALRGAAIYFDGNNCSPIISGNIISYNTNNSDGGGAIFCDNGSTPTISNNTISNNSAVGAGAFAGGITCSGNPTIVNNIITNNTSFMNGGGINCAGCNAFIAGNTIANNSASTFGGGIYCGSISYPTFIGNVISNNTSMKGGGFFLTAATNASISENIICNNTASEDGGGMYCEYGSVPNVLNSTITNNSAVKGGALYCTDGSVPVFRNCILYGNTASSNGAQVFLFDEGSDPDFYYCDIDGSSVAFDANGNYYSGTYQNNINTNPLFVATSGGSGQNFNGVLADWSLQINSPCIDSGDPIGAHSETDIEGNHRVNVCRIDMGAYEYQTGIPFVASLNITKPIPCYGFNAGEIEATITSGTGPYTYLWSNGQTTSKATGLAAGDYSVTIVQLSDGCSVTQNITLPQTWAVLISPDAGADKTIVCGGTAQLDVVTTYTETGTLTFEWAPSIGLNDSTLYNPTSTVTNNTKYIVTVTTPNGCVRKDSIMVFVNSLTAIAGMDKTIICDGTVQLDNVNSNYSGTGTLAYSWTPTTGLNDDSIQAPSATVTSNTKYYVSVSTPNGCTALDSLMVYINPLTADAGFAQPIVCGGKTQLDNVISNYTGTGILTYNWFPSIGLNAVTILNPTVEVIDNSTYYVTVTTSNGCSATDSVTVYVNPLTINGADVSITCGSGSALPTSTNYTGTDSLIYSWFPTTGLSDSTVANPFVSVDSNQTYSVTLTTQNGCIASDDVSIYITPMDAPEICIVGVEINKNLIVWNKTISTAIDSFFIFRESNITNIYLKIGAVSYDSLSIFVDTNSYPDVQSNKYKISVKDRCGLESNLGTAHKTMHLSINQGTGTTWNLIWDPYEGFTVSTYNIYRGTTPNNLLLIGTSSGSNTQYTDLTAPGGYVYYQVEVVSPNSCNPTRSYNSSRSNIASNNVNSVFDTNNEMDLISIYPNPVQDKIHITSINPDVLKQSLVSIFNIQGEQIMEYQYQNTDIIKLDVSELSKGIYFIKLKTKKNIIVKKFIKQ